MTRIPLRTYRYRPQICIGNGSLLPWSIWDCERVQWALEGGERPAFKTREACEKGIGDMLREGVLDD